MALLGEAVRAKTAGLLCRGGFWSLRLTQCVDPAPAVPDASWRRVRMAGYAQTIRSQLMH